MKKLLVSFSLFLLFSACIKNIKEYPYVLNPTTYEMIKKYDKDLSKNWVIKNPYKNEIFTTDYFDVVVFNSESGLLVMTEYHISKTDKLCNKNNSQKFAISFYNKFDKIIAVKTLIVGFDDDTIKRVNIFLLDRYYTIYNLKRVEVTQLKSHWR